MPLKIKSTLLIGSHQSYQQKNEKNQKNKKNKILSCRSAAFFLFNGLHQEPRILFQRCGVTDRSSQREAQPHYFGRPIHISHWFKYGHPKRGIVFII